MKGTLTTIDAEIGYLGSQPLHEAVAFVKQKTLSTFGKNSDRGKVPPCEWQRIAAALERCPASGSILDIGIGRGHTTNSFAAMKRYDRIVGIDIAAHSLFRSYDDDVEYYTMSVDELSFGDSEFDSVVCMEVLSQLTMLQIERALGEMRRVARRYLLVSVPFCQPVPLPKQHRQRFTPDEVRHLFPNGKLTLFIRGGEQRTPLLFIEEHLDQTPARPAVARRPDRMPAASAATL